MSTSKLIQKLFIATVGATFMAFLTPELVQAATLITNAINQANPDDALAGVCPEFGCEPGGVFFGNNVNNRALTLVNNTQYTITGISLELDENEDAIWGQGTSDIFSEITLFNNARGILYTGGTFSINTGATFVIESGDRTVNFSVRYNGVLVSVPEPNLALGTIMVGTLGAGLALKRKKVKALLN